MKKPVATVWRQSSPLLAEAIVCDGLMPWTKIFLPPGADLGTVLLRFRTAGVDHISLTAAAGNDDLSTALVCLGGLRRELSAHFDWLRLVDGPEEIRRAKADGMFSVAFHFQTCTPYSGGLDLVEAFRQAGISRAILAYNEANIFADGCHEPRDAGLSQLGRNLVRRMDEAGVRVDLSHCGERTTLNVLDMDLVRPPIFSHSNARALYDHERNITDRQIRLCAERGGYIGVNGVGMFLGVSAEAIPAAMAKHLAHIAGIAGTERIGIGLDFMLLENSSYDFYHSHADRWPRGYPPPPWDFLQPEQIGDLLAQLGHVGFSDIEIAGILGENYLRLAS